MKKIMTLITTLVVLNTTCNAQNGIIALRAGCGLTGDNENRVLGFCGALDFKLAKAPVVFSPYFQYYFSDKTLIRLYVGADVQIVKRLSEAIYFGIGGGMTRWSNNEKSRISPNIRPIVGMRIKILNNLSLFLEGSIFINFKDINSSTIQDISFHHDLTGIMGFSYLLK